jgi:GNAT superfamily N-acetyltransferase
VSFELRPATPRDTEAIVELQIAAWRAAFLPLLPPDFELPPRESFLIMGARALREAGVERTVAVAGERIAGLCTHGPSRDEDAGDEVGEVRALFVHPDHWRRGAGSALVSNALESLRGRGFAEATVWSFRDNERANTFYERCGFSRDGATQQREGFAGAVEIRFRLPLDRHPPQG